MAEQQRRERYLVIAKEFATILLALKSNYDNFNIQTNEQADFWFNMLKDLDGHAVAVAVQQHIMTSPFSPKISDIRKAVTETSMPKIMDPAEAWGEVTRAIRNFGIYQTEEAVASMSETTRNVIKYMNFREICLSENHMADRAHFIKLYMQHSESQRKNLMIAEPLRAEIEKLVSGMDMALLDKPKKT